NVLAVKPLHQSGVVGRVRVEAAAIPVSAANILTLDHDLADLPLIHLIEELGEGDILGYRALAWAKHGEDRPDQQSANCQDSEIAQISVHQISLILRGSISQPGTQPSS